MAKNEYLSNVYRVIFKKVALHFVLEFLEYLIILFSQVNLYTINFEFSLTEKIDSSYFYLTFIQKVNSIPEYAKIIILGLVFVMIIAYFLIYDQFAFERISIFNIIVINVFEIIGRWNPKTVMEDSVSESVCFWLSVIVSFQQEMYMIRMEK